MTEFRPELWPASRLHVPEVEAGPVYLDGGFLCAFEDGALSTLRRVSVTDELYLRGLQGLDLGDMEAVRGFTREHGSLYSSELWKVLEAADSDGSLKDDTDALRRDEYRLREASAVKATDLAQLWLKAAKERLGAAPSSERHRDMARLDAVGTPSFRATCHVDEVRWTVALLRDLVRVWAWQQGKLSFTTVQTEWESPVRPRDKSLWPSKDQALRMLEATLNLGLAELRASISFHGPATAATVSGETVSLFAALCVQFANHVADNSEYKRCENCGRWFVLQAGRAAMGQHRRKSVMYCSHSCARAKNERERYARRREEAVRATQAQKHASKKGGHPKTTDEKHSNEEGTKGGKP